jgi:hypothetical protein
MIRPKNVIEDRLTAAQKEELEAVIALIPKDLPAEEYISRLFVARQEAQRKAGY